MIGSKTFQASAGCSSFMAAHSHFSVQGIPTTPEKACLATGLFVVVPESRILYPGILEIYFSICLIWSTIWVVVGFSDLAFRKNSLAARNSRLVIMMEQS
jgi:hypothetical protein